MFRLSIPYLLSIVLFSLQLCSALYPTQLIYEFPNGTFVENLAVRPNGAILTTLATAPELYLIQPSSINPDPQLIHRFEGSTSTTGITEVSPDSFLIAVTSVSAPGQPIPGSSSVWRVTFPSRHSSKAKVVKIADLPNVLSPNGLAALDRKQVLLADSFKGVIIVIDIATGISKVAIQDPLLTPNERVPFGVNGLKIQGHTLYFTNTAQRLLGRIEIERRSGTARGPASVVVNTLPPAFGYDDFALNGTGQAFVANAEGNFIERVDLRTRQRTVVAGNINSTDIAEPTSAAFGRNGREDVLYVTTAGGFFFPINGDEIIGGQLVAVKLGNKIW